MNTVLGASGQQSLSHSKPQFTHRVSQKSSFLEKLISLPDRHPCMRYIYDITIIAIAIIAIVSILAASQGRGLLLFGLIPGLVLGALGLAMLISDVAQTKKAKKIADTLTAIFLPFTLLGIASLLFASAFVASGGSILIVANPLFLMGVLAISLTLISLHQVTFQHFKTEALIKEQKKIAQFIHQSPTALGPSQQHLSDEKLLAVKRKNPISTTSKHIYQSQQKRLAARQKRVRQKCQGNIVLHKKSLIKTLLSNGYEPDSSGDDEPSASNKKEIPTFPTPATLITPQESSSHMNLSSITAPLGHILSQPVQPSKKEQNKESRLRKVEKIESKHSKQQERHKRDEENSSEEEKSKKKKLRKRKK